MEDDQVTDTATTPIIITITNDDLRHRVQRREIDAERVRPPKHACNQRTLTAGVFLFGNGPETTSTAQLLAFHNNPHNLAGMSCGNPFSTSWQETDLSN